MMTPNKQNVRDFLARQQHKPAVPEVASTGPQLIERKPICAAKTVTMPLIVRNAPGAFLAYGSINGLRKAYGITYRAANEMLHRAYAEAYVRNGRVA